MKYALLFVLSSTVLVGCSSFDAGKYNDAPKTRSVYARDVDEIHEYYAKVDRTHGFMTMHVDPSWDATVQTQQVEIAVSNGYLPLSISGSDAETDFIQPIRRITGDGSSYELTWVQHPKVIKLDRDKLVAYFTSIGQLQTMVDLIQTYPQFSYWYHRKRC